MPQDTYILKGFFAYGNLPDNNEFQVSPLGELSVRSETFTKDRQLFSVPVGLSVDDTTAELSVFTSKLANNTKILVPSPFKDLVLQVGAWAYTQALLGTFTNDPEIFRQQLLTEFNGKINTPTIGAMVAQGPLFLPENIEFFIEPDGIGAVWGPERVNFDVPRVKLWFSDLAFSTQFDEFEIINVSPITTLDDFFNLSATVQTNVNARTIPQLMDTIQLMSAGNPYTILRSLDFAYIDPLDPTFSFKTTWSFIIYGPAGDSVDTIKGQLVNWILANSTHTREEWVVIFPDIFRSTEFIITPLWNQYAVPNKTLEEGVYSPSVNIVNADNIAQSTCVGVSYTPEYISANLSIVGSTYKSIALLICGGPENRDGIVRFENKWPDYMSVSTTNIDFNRMQPDTQDWVSLLYTMLKTAEKMTDTSDIPIGMSRLTRINASNVPVSYLITSFKDVQYMVVGKSWLLANFPPVNTDPVVFDITPAVGTLSTESSTSARVLITFGVVGGTAPFTFAAISTNIASGGINATTGAFDAIFDTPGFKTLRIEVTDSNNVTVGRDYTVEVPASAF